MLIPCILIYNIGAQEKKKKKSVIHNHSLDDSNNQSEFVAHDSLFHTENMLPEKNE